MADQQVDWLGQRCQGQEFKNLSFGRNPISTPKKGDWTLSTLATLMVAQGHVIMSGGRLSSYPFKIS